jgi:hypothetical protein
MIPGSVTGLYVLALGLNRTCKCYKREELKVWVKGHNRTLGQSLSGHVVAPSKPVVVVGMNSSMDVDSIKLQTSAKSFYHPEGFDWGG